MITFESPWNKVGIGNHFFIYSYMRLLSDNLKYKMLVPPIMFSERGDNHHQQEFNFENVNSGIDNTGNIKYGIDDGFTFRNETIDNSIEFFMEKKHHIVSCGYYQKYSYWKKYKNQVKGYFSEFIGENHTNKNDIAIHLRNSHEDPRFKLDSDYYIKSIEKFETGNVFLFADNFNRHNDLLNKFKSYNPILMDLNVPDTIKEITKFNNIICSQGSFSFWASFLSDAKKIICPITKLGPNKTDEWSIDYVVDDEERYEYVII